MPTQCNIQFDNEPDRVYYGGQSLNGRVTLSLTKEKTVRGTLAFQSNHYEYENLRSGRLPFVSMSVWR